MLPAPIAAAWGLGLTVLNLLVKGLKHCGKRKLTVEVLDGVAIGAALLQKTTQQLVLLCTLLGIGDILKNGLTVNPY